MSGSIKKHLIDKLTEFLSKPRELSNNCFDDGEDFEVYDIPFRVVETIQIDFLTKTSWHWIKVFRNDRLPLTTDDFLSNVYDADFDDESWVRKFSKRNEVCRQLASWIVEMLPNESMRARTELHNAEVDDILSVL